MLQVEKKKRNFFMFTFEMRFKLNFVAVSKCSQKKKKKKKKKEEIISKLDGRKNR